MAKRQSDVSESMSTSDYHEHIMRLVRTPSVATTDVPRYGNAPIFFRDSNKNNINARNKAEKADENAKLLEDKSAPGFDTFKWKTFLVK